MTEGKRCAGPCGEVKPLDAFRRRPGVGRPRSRCLDCAPLDPDATARDDAVRAGVFAHYGPACACCGTTDDLTIDHVNGDGAEHRRRSGVRCGILFYLWLIAEGFPGGYQTLCLPCNQSKASGPACRMHNPSPPSGSKRCTGPCGRVKDLDRFSPNASRLDGRGSRCRDCVNAASRARAAAARLTSPLWTPEGVRKNAADLRREK